MQKQLFITVLLMTANLILPCEPAPSHSTLQNIHPVIQSRLNFLNERRQELLVLKSRGFETINPIDNQIADLTREIAEIKKTLKSSTNKKRREADRRCDLFLKARERRGKMRKKNTAHTST